MDHTQNLDQNLETYSASSKSMNGNPNSLVEQHTCNSAVLPDPAPDSAFPLQSLNPEAFYKRLNDDPLSTATPISINSSPPSIAKSAYDNLVGTLDAIRKTYHREFPSKVQSSLSIRAPMMASNPVPNFAPSLDPTNVPNSLDILTRSPTISMEYSHRTEREMLVQEMCWENPPYGMIYHMIQDLSVQEKSNGPSPFRTPTFDEQLPGKLSVHNVTPLTLEHPDNFKLGENEEKDPTKDAKAWCQILTMKKPQIPFTSATVIPQRRKTDANDFSLDNEITSPKTQETMWVYTVYVWCEIGNFSLECEVQRDTVVGQPEPWWGHIVKILQAEMKSSADKYYAIRRRPLLPPPLVHTPILSSYTTQPGFRIVLQNLGPPIAAVTVPKSEEDSEVRQQVELRASNNNNTPPKCLSEVTQSYIVHQPSIIPATITSDPSSFQSNLNAVNSRNAMPDLEEKVKAALFASSDQMTGVQDLVLDATKKRKSTMLGTPNFDVLGNFIKKAENNRPAKFQALSDRPSSSNIGKYHDGIVRNFEPYTSQPHQNIHTEHKNIFEIEKKTLEKSYKDHFSEWNRLEAELMTIRGAMKSPNLSMSDSVLLRERHDEIVSVIQGIQYKNGQQKEVYPVRETGQTISKSFSVNYNHSATDLKKLSNIGSKSIPHNSADSNLSGSVKLHKQLQTYRSQHTPPLISHQIFSDSGGEVNTHHNFHHPSMRAGKQPKVTSQAFQTHGNLTMDNEQRQKMITEQELSGVSQIDTDHSTHSHQRPKFFQSFQKSRVAQEDNGGSKRRPATSSPLVSHAHGEDIPPEDQVRESPSTTTLSVFTREGFGSAATERAQDFVKNVLKTPMEVIRERVQSRLQKE